jgi:arsenate reductase (glutaredoxin)
MIFYHNPRCSKSREAKALLEQRGVRLQVIEYLETPPSASELDAILKKLGMEPRELLRTKESAYAEAGLARPGLTRAQIIETMVAHPILIERPILVNGPRAVLGRPPERVLEILTPS